MHPTSSPLVVFGMANLAVLVGVALVLAYARASGKTPLRFAAAVVAWLAVVAGLGAAGVLRHESRPPPLFLMMLIAVVLVVLAARSSIGDRLARSLPLAAIIGFQAFRLPLELVMHRAASEGTMPVQMSFSGWNFDIVTGASAIVMALLVARGMAPRWLVQAWAVMSTALLAIIVVIAIASTPAFAAFGASPDRLNTWIGFFPFSLLPGALVPAALFGQLILFKRLALERVSDPAARSERSRA
jgi:hypothetical protein